jgi:DNA-binding CsgD family transcriptional regulator/tetratricopeptide (TPR) repeat protein
MELVERSAYLEKLDLFYQRVLNGEGHTVFLFGEAGVGKTSVVNQFIKENTNKGSVLTGACDSLFTPRPLGPLVDVAGQVSVEFQQMLRRESDRAIIFSSLIDELSSRNLPVILVFEDIHWADEATIDLIKFLARRIHRLPCLFLLTYRDEEIHARHALKNVFGELMPATFSKISIQRLSRTAVLDLATRRGHNSGEKLFDLTGGNPFYVTEILANESNEIPERVKDSILTVFNSKDNSIQALWEILSILPSRIEPEIANRIEHDFPNGIDQSIQSGVLVSKSGYTSFKHELFRLTIEESLSPSKRRDLHRKVLNILNERPGSANLSQLVHHARVANERQLVATLAPKAAQEASSVGSHIEASKHYQTAIEFIDKNDPALCSLYERHAYECYLTNQISSAIQSQQHALDIWRQLKVSLKEGDALRFLSRLWWFEGDRLQAIKFAKESIDILENGFPTRERALSYSNLAQLYMLADDRKQALDWGNKAIELATRMNDAEVLSHALNNVGAAILRYSGNEDEGQQKLNQSLEIALKNGLHEHAARAYTNLSFTHVLGKRYGDAIRVFDEGLKYCEDLDLNSWTYYMQSEKVNLLLETGAWNESERLSESLASYAFHPAMVRIGALVTLARLKTRRGSFDEAKVYIDQAKTLANRTGEAQRIIPVLSAELELCFVSGSKPPIDEVRKAETSLFHEKDNSHYYTMLAYWMTRCGISIQEEHNFTGAFDFEYRNDWKRAVEKWRAIGCPYEEALALFESGDEGQKQALKILDSLGATATLNLLKTKMKERGVTSIPRGIRESTRNNPAQLTNRQIEVLNLLREGLQNAEIADRLFISNKTVDHHISAIFLKLDVNSRVRAVTKAQQLGILTDH